MEIKITKYEMDVSDADAIVKIVNEELESKNWYVSIENNMPEFIGNGKCRDWSIKWDRFYLAWKLNFGFECVGVVEFEDDIDILWNR